MATRMATCMALGKEFNHLAETSSLNREIYTHKFYWVYMRIKWDNMKTLGKVFSEIQTLSCFYYSKSFLLKS